MSASEMPVIESLSIFIAVFFAALCLYFSRNFFFWKNRGFPYVKYPLPFVGNVKDVALMKTSSCCFLKDLYLENKDKPYIGIIVLDTPKLVVTDLDLVKRILVKDAHLFLNRNLNIDEELDPLTGKSILALRGHRWKLMRTMLTPSYSSNKIKKMFHLVNNSCKQFLQHLEKEISGGSQIFLKKTIWKFSIDTIISCSCGVEINSGNATDTDIRYCLVECIHFTYKKLAAMLFMNTSRLIQKLLRLKFIDDHLSSITRETVWKIVEYRENHGIVKNDFLESLMKLRKKMHISGDHGNTTETQTTLDGDDFVSQVASIWLAASESSSSTITFALYELALHPDIQHRLRMEITQVLTERNQEVTYEAIQEMKYLDMVVSETLRKYPIIAFIDRENTVDYELPDPSGKGTLTLPAGTGITIPSLGIHMDPEYYPDPEKFHPERFNVESNLSRPNSLYLPFGLGPRMCLGMQFGLIEVKTALAHILSRYQVAPCKETPLRIDFDPLSLIILSSAHEIPVIFSEVMASTTNRIVVAVSLLHLKLQLLEEAWHPVRKTHSVLRQHG